MAGVHLIFVTHTDLHLRRALVGAACQTRRADAVVVSCDVVSAAIEAVIDEAARTLGLTIALVQRPHTGRARCGQARNNAVRALVELGAAGAFAVDARTDRLVFIDGDTVPRSDLLAVHERLGGPDHLVSTYRVMLTPEQTSAWDETRLHAGQPGVDITPAQAEELEQRHRRYQRQAMWRRLGLGKPHKPRLIGGHFSVPMRAYLEVNGCDEAYEGYGQEDDDLARRLHRSGWPSVVAVRQAVVFHQHHPARAPGNWHDAPGVQRFNQRTPNRAVLGIDHPAPQGAPTVQVFRPDGVGGRVDLEPRTAPIAR